METTVKTTKIASVWSGCRIVTQVIDDRRGAELQASVSQQNESRRDSTGLT